MQRWPAVPIAAKAIARNASSRSAEGQTIAALLPPSSGMARAKRCASRGATLRPIAVDPVADTRGSRGSSSSNAAVAWSPIKTADNPLGVSPNFCAARSKSACTASAVRGVFSDGFQTTVSPQTSASAAFQDHTATGKLNVVITPIGPSGCHCSIMRCSGRSLAIVRP